MNNLLAEIKQRDMIALMGNENLNLTESIGLFFKEISNSVDKKLASMSGSIHKVDYLPTKRFINNNKILYTQNTGVEITAPSYVTGEFAEMNYYVGSLISSILVVSTLKSETSSMYKWLKDIVKTGRADTSYRWASSLTDNEILKAHKFLSGLSEPKKQTLRLGQLYNNFEECFDLINHFNNAVGGIKARDTEIIANDLSNIYGLGNLLIAKIEANELTMSKDTIGEINYVVHKWIDLVNIGSAIIGLLNELTAVFTEQLKEFQSMK